VIVNLNNLNNMIHYYIILILIALASGIVGFYATRIIMNINAYRTRLKHKRKQVPRYKTGNWVSDDFDERLDNHVRLYAKANDAYNARFEELEKQVKNRQTNFKQRVREEVRIYLEELKK